MKLSKLFNQFVIAPALFTIACNAPATEQKQEFEDPIALICLPEKGAAFRGIALGATPAEVYDAIGYVPEQSSDTLIIEIIEPEKSGFNAKVYYSFDGYGLFEIQADIFADDMNQLKESVPLYKTYFTDKFGESACKGNNCRWTTFSKNNNTVEVNLSDESGDAEVPFVSINFLEPLNDAF